MSATDDPPPDTDVPAPKRRAGRPGLTHEQIADAFERFVSREGRVPSQTELRAELGHRGSFTTIARARTELVGERLVAGTDAPERGAPEATLYRAVSAAMGVVSAEAAEAADARVAEGQRVADERVAAADARTARAKDAEETAARERERALGRAEVLADELAAVRREREAVNKDLTAALGRESELRDAAGALRVEVAEQREALEHRRTEAVALEERLGAVETALEGERTERAADAERANATERRLERVEVERDAAVGRADEAAARAERLEGERAAASERADRLEGEAGALRDQVESRARELDAARRTGVDLAGHAGRLRARLVAEGVVESDIEPVPEPRAVEKASRSRSGRGKGG